MLCESSYAYRRTCKFFGGFFVWFFLGGNFHIKYRTFFIQHHATFLKLYSPFLSEAYILKNVIWEMWFTYIVILSYIYWFKLHLRLIIYRNLSAEITIVVSVAYLGILCHGLKLYNCPIKSRKAAIYHSYTTTEMGNSLSVLFNKSSLLQYPLPGTYTIYYLLGHNHE